MTGESSSIENVAASGEASAPVPDVLLSLAKDDRYISEVFSLLSQAIVPFASIFIAPRRNSGGSRTANNNNTRSRDFIAEETLEDDGKKFIERIRPELYFLASILVQSATFVFYTRSNFGGGDQVNDVGVHRSIGMEALHLSYNLPHGTNCRTALSQNTSMLRRMKYRISSALFQLNAWHRLLFLQTVVPYLINRVGRGGWSQDLGGLISTLLENCGLRQINEVTTNRSATQQESEPNNELDDSAFRNDDMLRGSARRRLFLEQRRRMMNSSDVNQRSSLLASADSEDDEGALTVQQNQVHHENASFSERGENATAFAKRWNQLCRLSWEVTRRMAVALSTLSHGAHQLPRHIGLIENQDKYTNIIKWLLRLHLAVFYWSGVYPTIYHRIADAKIHDGTPPTAAASSAIVANRPTYKPIAALIFLQAGSALLQTAASASIEVAHKLQIAYFRWNRQGRTQGQRRRISSNETESERTEYLEMVETRVPGIDSSSKESTTSPQKKSKPSNATESHHPCGICLNERIHPAAPS